jgi:hypothetical protein
MDCILLQLIRGCLALLFRSISADWSSQDGGVRVWLPYIFFVRDQWLGDLKSPATNRQPGLSPQAQQTETVQPGVPWSLRAKAKAFSAGISRIFLTGLPRRPKNSTSQGVEPSFWTPG